VTRAWNFRGSVQKAIFRGIYSYVLYEGEL
jgi:hypothetical protein